MNGGREGVALRGRVGFLPGICGGFWGKVAGNPQDYQVVGWGIGVFQQDYQVRVVWWETLCASGRGVGHRQTPTATDRDLGVRQRREVGREIGFEGCNGVHSVDF